MASHMQAMKRLAKEARSLEESPPPYISAAPIDDDDLFTWRAILSGVKGTPLEGTAIVCELTFPTDFPKNAPNAGGVRPYAKGFAIFPSPPSPPPPLNLYPQTRQASALRSPTRWAGAGTIQKASRCSA